MHQIYHTYYPPPFICHNRVRYTPHLGVSPAICRVPDWPWSACQATRQLRAVRCALSKDLVFLPWTTFRPCPRHFPCVGETAAGDETAACAACAAAAYAAVAVASSSASSSVDAARAGAAVLVLDDDDTCQYHSLSSLTTPSQFSCACPGLRRDAGRWCARVVGKISLPILGRSATPSQFSCACPGLRRDASKSHTHPSHSQTSRLLTSSLSLCVPVPRPTQCVRGE